MVLPLFYKNVVPLNKHQHGDWFVEPLTDFTFAAQTNSVLLLAAEFFHALRDYPIIFVREKETVFPAAVLGLRDRQNLFVVDSGGRKDTWDASYVPAYVRRYPFIPAEKGEDQLTLCIDQDYPGLNREGRGARLFEEDGSLGQTLSSSVAFVQEFHVQLKNTEEFCRRIVEAGLLEPMSASIEKKGGEKFSLTGFQVINRKALAGLNAEQLQGFFANGSLELIYAHLFSLRNFERLLGRI